MTWERDSVLTLPWHLCRSRSPVTGHDATRMVTAERSTEKSNRGESANDIVLTTCEHRSCPYRTSSHRRAVLLHAR